MIGYRPTYNLGVVRSSVSEHDGLAHFHNALWNKGGGLRKQTPDDETLCLIDYLLACFMPGSEEGLEVGDGRSWTCVKQGIKLPESWAN